MTDAERERTHCLWDPLARAAPAHVDSSARHLLETVSGWIGAERAGWVGTSRALTGAAATQDALLGWRFHTIVYPPPPTDVEAREARKVVRKGLEEARTGMSIVEVLRHAGTFRVHRLRGGFVDLAQFAQTYPYDTHDQLKEIDRKFGVKSRTGLMAVWLSKK